MCGRVCERGGGLHSKLASAAGRQLVRVLPRLPPACAWCVAGGDGRGGEGEGGALPPARMSALSGARTGERGGAHPFA